MRIISCGAGAYEVFFLFPAVFIHSLLCFYGDSSVYFLKKVFKRGAVGYNYAHGYYEA